MSSSGTGYLTYVPWPGDLNNTRMCLELMLTLSVLLQRTLVIPADLYSPIADIAAEYGGTQVRRLPPDPRDLFDFTGLRDFVDIEIGSGWPPIPPLENKTPRDLNIDPLREAICFPSLPPKGSRRFRDLLAFLADRRAVVLLSEDLRDVEWVHVSRALGHFYTTFFLDRRRDVFIKRMFRDRFGFHPAMLQAAAPLIKQLGSYSAVHVRRGDFLDQYPRAVVSAEVILKSLRTRIPARSRLYIATNETDRSFFDPIARVYDVRMFDDLKADRNLLRYEAACADMLICASAEIFVGNRLSTFSGYITRMRGYRGAADTGIYFTDGSCARRERQRKGRSRFSWQDSISAGTPLWGREYSEGWEFESA